MCFYLHLLVTVVLPLRMEPSTATTDPSNVTDPLADRDCPLSEYVNVHVPSRSV